MKKTYVKNRLFAEPSFIEGFARVLDIAGTLQVYNESSSDNEADAVSLNNDWRAIGQDLSNSIKKYEQGIVR